MSQERIEELEQEIAEISRLMRGPLDNLDRACYHLERKDLRGEIAKMKVEISHV